MNRTGRTVRLPGILILTLALALPASPRAASGQQVDLALALLLDASGSVDATEFNLQKKGYVDAFMNSSVWAAISSGAIGSIAVNFSFWSYNSYFQNAIGWTVLDSEAAMNAFATQIGGLTRPFSGGTELGLALTRGADTYTNGATGLNALGISATRWVMDISGDGCTNDGTVIDGVYYNPSNAAAAARDYAVSQGVDQINGLVINPYDDPCGYVPETNVLQHYQNQVAYNGFVTTASDFTTFGDAIDDKIIREVVGVPEPGSLPLLASALLLFGFAIVRRNGVAEA